MANDWNSFTLDDWAGYTLDQWSSFALYISGDPTIEFIVDGATVYDAAGVSSRSVWNPVQQSSVFQPAIKGFVSE